MCQHWTTGTALGLGFHWQCVNPGTCCKHVVRKINKIINHPFMIGETFLMLGLVLPAVYLSGHG